MNGISLISPQTRLIAVILFSLGMSACTCGPSKVGVAPRATPSAIRAIKFGMPAADVLGLLGPPIATEPAGAMGTIWWYSRDPDFANSYARVKIYMQGDAVDRVVVRGVSLWGADAYTYYILQDAGTFDYYDKGLEELLPAVVRTS